MGSRKCAVRPMWPVAFSPIIVGVSADPKTAAKEATQLGAMGTEASDRPASAIVAVCGDPVVGQALALLLRSARYEATFVRVGASGEPGPLGNLRAVVSSRTSLMQPAL